MSERLDEAFKASHEALRATYKGLPLVPLIAAFSPAGQLIIAVPFKNNREKYLFIAMAREQVRQKGATHFVATVEAWTSPAPEGADIRNHKGLMPSEHPDREEIILIHGEDRDGSSRSGFYTLVRKPKNSKRAKLGEWNEDIESGSYETTLFTNMFGRMLQ